MAVPTSMPRRTITGFVLSLALWSVASTGIASAADPPVPGPLDRPIVDLALAEPGGDPDQAPRLLTLDSVDQPSGTVRVALLDRAAGWLPISSLTVPLLGPADGAEDPWLIEIGSGRFVVLSTSHQMERTSIASIDLTGIGNTTIEVAQPTILPMAVDDAGAIDVDGDGARELIVSSAVTRHGGDVCQGSVIDVLDGTSLARRAEWAVPDTRLAGGVLGEWDGLVGGDLLAYAYGNCPAGPDAARRLGVVAIRLADGLPIVALSPSDPAASTTSPGVPLAADLDGDGRDEAVVRDGDALVILEPARGWRRTELAGGDVLPMSAVASEGGRPGTLAWIANVSADEVMVASIGRDTKSADGPLAVTDRSLDLTGVSRPRRTRVLAAMRDVAVAQTAPQAWHGDLDGDGCTDILGPLLTAQCPAQAWQGDLDGDGCTDILGPLLTAQCPAGPNASIKVGATWFATRPVVAFEGGQGRELLIVSTMDWKPGLVAPAPASPAAVGPPGGWRHGPSPRFVLSEVRAVDAAYFDRFPVPRPTIERAPVRSNGTDFPGFTGARVFVRVISARPDDPPPAPAPSLDDFLSAPAAGGELITVVRVPVPEAAKSGRDGSFVHLSLADVVAPDGELAERWTVTIAQVNEWGEIAGPVRGTIVRDSTGPSLTLDVPFLSAPWPLEATVQGRSEPGVEIRGGTGGPVTADRRGRFELRTQLVPWPQTVELTAIDQSGNTTTSQFSLVGGVDYRSFPWAAIVAAALLLGAILSAGRGATIRRDLEVIESGDPLPEIEELPAIRERTRA